MTISIISYFIVFLTFSQLCRRYAIPCSLRVPWDDDHDGMTRLGKSDNVMVIIMASELFRKRAI